MDVQIFPSYNDNEMKEKKSKDDRCSYGMSDEEYAAKHFYGKTIEEASELFFLNSEYYVDDLRWMGFNAYFYYMNSTKRYLQSNEGKYDDTFIFYMISILESRLKNEPDFKSAFNYHKKEILDILLIIEKNIDDYLMADDDGGNDDFLGGSYNNVPERLSHLINLCKTDE